MRGIFFYGSLRDRQLAEIVLGRPLAPDDMVAASVQDHAAYRMADEAYPALLPAPGMVAEGVLLLAPRDADIARLAFYEEAEYGLADIDVLTAEGPRKARYFCVTQKTPTQPEAWDYQRWQAEDRDVALHAADELMAYYGRLPEERIDEIWSAIMIRARQRARAERLSGSAGSLGSPFGSDDVEVERRDRVFAGFLSVEEYELRHRRFDGSWSDRVSRSAVVWGDAVTVLPYDPVHDRLLLIEQFRPGPLARGDHRPWCIEVVAGRIDGDEEAEAVARREAAEEAGLTLGRLEPMGGYYPTSGLAAEHLTSFVGEASLPDLGESVHGLASEHEDIRAIVLDFEAAMKAVGEGSLNTAPALLSVLWLAANRGRLRALWSV